MNLRRQLQQVYDLAVSSRVDHSVASGMLSKIPLSRQRSTSGACCLAAIRACKCATLASVDLGIALTDLKALKIIEEGTAFKAQRSML